MGTGSEPGVLQASLAGLLALLLLPVCGPAAAADPLADAAAAAAEGNLGEALRRLRAAFDAGYPAPGRVYTDPRFEALRETAGVRGEWRDLMGEFVLESEVAIAGPAEPGTPMRIRGRVVRSPDGAAVPGAVVYLYHTDATGNYEPGVPAGRAANPRLFAWVRTDDEGRFEVRTIKAEPYPGASPRGAHVHYRIRAEGYEDASGDFRPYTHPSDEADRASAIERRAPSSVVRQEGDELICEATIPLRRS